MPTRPSPLEAQQHSHVDREHGARQRVIPRQEIAKTVRQAKHPLAHGHTRQHAVDEAGRVIGHAPAPPAPGEAATPSRERPPPPAGAIAAPEAGASPPQHTPPEESPKIPFPPPPPA